MTIGYFGSFVKTETPLSSQEIHELLQIRRIMKFKKWSCMCFLFLFTNISVGFFILVSCSERDSGNCHDTTEKRRGCRYF